MRKPVILFFLLALILFAATAKNTVPAKPLPPEDTLFAKADYPNQGAQIQIWQSCAALHIKGIPHTLHGTATRDKYGAVELVESPTGNAVTILPDGSCDAYLDGVRYQFEFERE